MNKLLYIVTELICGGSIFAATSCLSKKVPLISKVQKIFQQGDTVRALKALETAGDKGDISACRYLYHYYVSINRTPAEAFAEVEKVIAPYGDWIWYGEPDKMPERARLPTCEELIYAKDNEPVVQDTLPGNDITVQWYWLRRAAQFGDAESQREYGETVQFALGSDSAMVWWEKSALQDYPRGLLFYGNELYNQAIVKKSQTIGLKAFQMLTKAYNFGKEVPSAGWYLGLCYLNAVGTSEDIDKGIECLRQSAKYGYSEAIIEMPELGLEDSPYWERTARKEGLK